MVFTEKDKEKFEKATHCHICEEALPKNSTKVDHLAKIKDWLKILGLSGRMPTYKEVEDKLNHFKEISDDLFLDTN